ncbi:MAG: BlaI/MecI/CopY family transcriptional regulator [Bacteroidota bacterium]|nr:BlaI/MecI/CopY family transcriptional regulator [Bacteroidota bacterium]
MRKLATREDQIMQIIWKLEKAFVKDVIEEFPAPKPHYNTIATLMKILKDKGFLTDEKFGNTFEYKPLISLEDYRRQDVENVKKKYFGNSFKNMITHFAKEEKMSDSEIDEIIRIIKSEKKSKS